LEKDEKQINKFEVYSGEFYDRSHKYKTLEREEKEKDSLV